MTDNGEWLGLAILAAFFLLGLAFGIAIVLL